MLELSVIGLATVFAGMTLLWLFSLALKDASIVDIFWGLGFVALVWLYWALSGERTDRGLLVAILVTLWGVRLAVHILTRNWGHGEDKRYTAMREGWGSQFWWVSLFQVFWLQGLLMWIIAFPLFFAQQSAADLWLLTDLVGVSLWVVGFLFEVVADLQLARFKANPDNKGKVLNSGLWRYSRHPNYFGESVLWWGLFLIAVSVPNGLWTVFSPILMTTLLLKVSGVAMLEKTITERRPKYRNYIESTSAFIPWPPKKSN